MKLFCIGHEHVDSGIDINGPRLVILNSDHERGQALPLDLAHIPAADEALLQAIPLGAM